MSRKAWFGICICLFVRHISAELHDTNFTKFIFHGNYSGFLCPVDSTMFRDYGNVDKCVIKCNMLPSCNGVFVHSDKKLCVGCRKPYITTDDNKVPYLNGTSYFRRRTFLKVNEKRKWEDAKKHCEDLGGYLADIKSQAEERFIVDQLLQDVYDDIWIGATDKNGDSFLWCDGSNVSDHYSNWADDEPDTGPGDKNDHCVELRNSGTTAAWRDSYCGSYFTSLCEFD